MVFQCLKAEFAQTNYVFPTSKYYLRGYEFWKNKTETIISGGGNFTFTFTLRTDDPYYIKEDATLVLLERVKVLAQSSLQEIPLRIKLNGYELFTHKLSPKLYAESFIGFDLAPSPFFNETGVNSVTVENLGDVPISILSIFVYRIFEYDFARRDDDLKALWYNQLIETIKPYILAAVLIPSFLVVFLLIRRIRRRHEVLLLTLGANIKVWLPKGDKEAAKKAIQLIKLYSGIEEES